jgi:hypothetical protein
VHRPVSCCLRPCLGCPRVLHGRLRLSLQGAGPFDQVRGALGLGAQAQALLLHPVVVGLALPLLVFPGPHDTGEAYTVRVIAYSPAPRPPVTTTTTQGGARPTNSKPNAASRRTKSGAPWIVLTQSGL